MYFHLLYSYADSAINVNVSCDSFTLRQIANAARFELGDFYKINKLQGITTGQGSGDECPH